MSDQSKLGIGQIITTEQFKDAIHVAVAPIVAGEKLSPGEYVAIRKDGTAMGPTDVDKEVGIVDPFLRRPVKSGERFWLFLIPGSITSLRHDWSHPAFQEATGAVTAQETPREKSEAWLRQYAERYWTYTPPEDRYEKMLSQIKTGTLTYEGFDMHGLYDLEDAEELRKHASVVLGYQVNWGDAEYFSCTC